MYRSSVYPLGCVVSRLQELRNSYPRNARFMWTCLKMEDNYIYCLVVWNMLHCSYILGTIIPTDIFQRGRYTTSISTPCHGGIKPGEMDFRNQWTGGPQPQGQLVSEENNERSGSGDGSKKRGWEPMRKPTS